jgi:DNA/RNA-binding domain of Phe-tRNA-synthetase-like protein
MISDMFPIKVESEILNKVPLLTLGCFEAKVNISPSSKELLLWITRQLEQIKVSLTAETIRQMATVKATKDAYRTLGKDPNRYRPAAESLMRRIANGKELYQICNAVDILNYISIKTGYSICGYDARKIEGEVTMGIGFENEPYQGIGRGTLNIESLPVFRDSKGAFGTPTSDSTRTMISENTKEILFIFIGFEGKDELNSSLEETSRLLSLHARATAIETYFI